jgi:serine/threonine protein kinase
MRHVELDRIARGKRFDLRDMSTDDGLRCKTWIKRHPNVCEMLREHPNVMRNITAFHDSTANHYWVIDEWVEGITLERRLRRGPMTIDEVVQLLTDLANGLLALHEHGIIRRELHPASILLRESDGRAILTEFELSKLVERGPTVSTGHWPKDPYRAGEACGEDVDVRADIYSWARIGAHALLGKLPEVGDDERELIGAQFPKALCKLLGTAASVLRSNRPSSFNEVLAVLGATR